MTICGATKVVQGRIPLICRLEAEHAGPHGIRQVPGLTPYVQWDSYDDHQLAAVRVICRRCGRAYDMVVPQAECAICHGR